MQAMYNALGNKAPPFTVSKHVYFEYYVQEQMLSKVQHYEMVRIWRGREPCACILETKELRCKCAHF